MREYSSICHTFVGTTSFIVAMFFVAPFVSMADEFTSSSYRVLDPLITPAGFSTSAGFQLWGNLAQVAVGTSTASSFQLGAGFLRYPFASTPAVSTTAGDAQVALSWTASQGFLGWTASGYKVGQSTSSSGPYAYTDVGNVTSSTQSGLTNGTPYYFVIVVKDIFGNTIATSTQAGATPTSSVTPPPATPPPSGGGGGGVIPVANVIFSGRAYPLSRVVVLKDGQIAISTIAGPDARFEVSLSGLVTGDYTFAVYGEDGNGARSNLFTFPLYITTGASTKVSGIFLSPTIAVDKSEVKRGEDIVIFGQSTPTSEITISVNSNEEFFKKKVTDENGVYLLNFDTSVLDLGQHHTKSKTALSGEVSSFSKVVGFIVGTKNVLAQSTKVVKGDLNNDGRVNLVDFSIAAYWYKLPLSALFKVTEVDRLNGDGKIDLVDFSIMAYYWTG